MKTLKLLSLLALTLTFTFCNLIETDEDEEIEIFDQEVVIDEQENVPLDANNVFNGLIIEGANIIDGDGPQPNGNISFSIEETSTALIKEGFDISFNSNENIAGAYLIVSDINGNKASSYFDIPESAFGDLTSPTNTNNRQLFKKENNNNRIGAGNSNIIIDFLETLNAGIFCYSLCVYDSNGNISLPQTVCVTIQNYGGNPNLLGFWNLSRFQENYDGTSIDVGLNEEFCFPQVLYCDNGNTLNYNECETITEFYMEFFEDGTYRYFIKENDTDFDWEASTSSCSIVGEYVYHYEALSEGNWAYNNNENKLLMASYYYYWNENGVIEEEFLGAGNAEFLFDIPVNVTGNTFVLDFSDSEEQLIYTFQK